jgi:hypothetical protein
LAYPNIDNEISRLESEIDSLEQTIGKYEVQEDEFQKNLLATTQGALYLVQSDLENAYQVKYLISRTYSKMSIQEREIIKSRFWSDDSGLVPWKEVCFKAGYHRSSVEKMYKKILERALSEANKSIEFINQKI